MVIQDHDIKGRQKDGDKEAALRRETQREREGLLNSEGQEEGKESGSTKNISDAIDKKKDEFSFGNPQQQASASKDFNVNHKPEKMILQIAYGPLQDAQPVVGNTSGQN